MSRSRGKARRRGAAPPRPVVAAPEDAPQPRRGWAGLLGWPAWTGVAAIAGIAALAVAVLDFAGKPGEGAPPTRTPVSVAPPPGGDTSDCGRWAAGDQNVITINCGNSGATGPQRSAAASRGPQGTNLAGPALRPQPGPPTAAGPAPRPATSRAKTPQPPQTTTPAPTGRPAPPEPPGGIVTTRWPTFVAVGQDGGGEAVDTQAAADFQVEARHVSPLHGTEVLRTAEACRHSTAYTVHGVGFEPAGGARFCVYTRLGRMAVLEIEPTLTGADRPYPYTLRVYPG